MYLPFQDWELHQDVLGNFSEIDELKIKIFRGGIEPNIRFEYFFLLISKNRFFFEISTLGK